MLLPYDCSASLLQYKRQNTYRQRKIAKKLWFCCTKVPLPLQSPGKRVTEAIPIE
ncbi:hypothetical protein HMPREF1981_02727 [Bacteroides pyogenes F0041]|uniref:Uncharacterized protein n=1 Tax=Bacteroides pyogenes F0041 TaxID=1321819 RepID=U2DKH9_9BACE|nr:hypothetical protein HMPREF1981_02727 [Bacteroides pyogenes F0041]